MPQYPQPSLSAPAICRASKIYTPGPVSKPLGYLTVLLPLLRARFFVCEMVVNRNPPVTEVLRGRRGMASVKCLYTQLEYFSLFKASSHSKQTPFF